ncbi:MAG: hypothetical protein CM15mV41_0910 [Caudoviricetes sp.]|nr:MAG: hypothetical protein CM15mV41_0910 [Caudoviricetes sp.]
MPLVNQEAERIVRGMKKSRHRFKDLYGKRDKEVMYATANKLAQENKQNKGLGNLVKGFWRRTKVAIVLSMTGLARVSLLMAASRFNSVVNMQENPALNNQTNNKTQVRFK